MIKHESERKKSSYTKLGKDMLPVPKTNNNIKEVSSAGIGRSTISGEKIYNNKLYKKERPISAVYPVIDTDLARDNIENDLTSADLQDLERPTNF